MDSSESLCELTFGSSYRNINSEFTPEELPDLQKLTFLLYHTQKMKTYKIKKNDINHKKYKRQLSLLYDVTSC
jgi:hypothetical protein